MPVGILWSVLVVDDHELVVRGVRDALSGDPQWHRVLYAPDAETAIEVAERQLPDVVLLDLKLKHSHGLQLIEPLRAAVGTCRVVIHTAETGASLAVAAMAAGADGYVVKDEPTAALRRALDAVMRGERYVSPEIGAQLAALNTMPPLSDRDRALLEAIAAGHTNVRAAEQLGMKPRTFDLHKQKLYVRLQLANRSDVIAYLGRDPSHPSLGPS